MRRQPQGRGLEGRGTAGGESRDVIREPRYAKPALPADIDALEWRQIEADVERQSVITRAAANPQADAGEFGARDIDPRRLARALRRHAQLGNIGNHGI